MIIKELLMKNCRETERLLSSYEEGMIELEKIIIYKKRKFIKKGEYNQRRKEIEKTYFNI